jgi:hypothetical protein
MDDGGLSTQPMSDSEDDDGEGSSGGDRTLFEGLLDDDEVNACSRRKV